MQYLNKLYHTLCEQYEQHSTDVLNYTIPQSWNTFGFGNTKVLRNHEMILQPYEFYAYATKNILSTPSCEETKQVDWRKESITYFMDLRTFSSWDHDRSGDIEQSNMYGLSDCGTFLKAIVLLPLLQRSGINTLILHNYLALDKCDAMHDYADPHAVLNHHTINPYLSDSMLSTLPIEDQMHAFMEACHHYGMHVILNISPALCGQHSTYAQTHPQWFYWLHSGDRERYHAPQTSVLPQGCMLSQQVCQILYDSEDVKAHLSMFTHHPNIQNSDDFIALVKRTSLHEAIKLTHKCVVAPLIGDQINATLPPSSTCTLLRFYEDLPTYCPKEYAAPYMLSDTMRCDKFPGKKKMTSLWKELQDILAMWIQEYDVDGFYITKTYLLPDELLQAMATRIHEEKAHAACLLECMDEKEFTRYQALGFDAVSGNSAYRIHDVYDYQYHNFAYSLFTSPTPQFSASEFLDTPRICAYERGEVLAQLLSIMNLFLPNTIPCFMGGQLSLEKQPQYLSAFADQRHLNILDKENPLFRKQAMLDTYSYNYTRRDFHVLINLLEKAVAIRKSYIEAISDVKHCTPLCFDTPKDMGIGFGYTLDHKALLVICNTNIHEHTHLHIHTEHMLWKLPFAFQQLRQIFSNDDPYVHDVRLDEMNRIPLEFAPGEVKCIEIT